MRKLIELLFNVKPASWTEGGQWRLDWLALPRQDMALLALAVAAAVIGIIAWVYRRDARSLSAMKRWSLVSLRLLVLAGALTMLMEPVLVFEKTEYSPSNLIVLNDVSGSIDLQDAYTDTKSAQAVAAALKLSGPAEVQKSTRAQLSARALDLLATPLAAAGDRIVRHHDFAARLLPAGSATRPSAADASATAIGAAIRQAIAAYQGQPLAGILLVTDGQSNAGESPVKAAQFAAAEGVPIVCLGLGTAQGPRAARITKLDVSPVVFVRDPNPLHVLVESRGMAEQPATVVLERSRDGGSWEEVSRQNVVLGETGRIQTATFQFQEDRPASLRLRARLEDAGPELAANDHEAVADVKVIRDKIKVLFIAGETFPEVEFIRAMLLRDTSISASTWLQSADANYDQPGDPSLKRLPETAEELNDYDCIVLYDPDPDVWPANYSQLLQDFVSKAGGGIVYVAGERNTKNLYDRPDDPSLAWLNMLPVTVEPGLYHTDVTVKLSTESPWKLDITPEGKNDPIFTFAERPEENETILANLPGMFWYFPVTRARPGATVLARHGDPRMVNEYGPHVLLATQLVGPGRTFFVGFDSTYRWRYLDDRFFDSFWAHMVERAGRSKQLGGRYPYSLATDRATYAPGSQVTLTATFENPADRDAGLDSLHGEVQVGDQQPTSLTLTPRAGDATTFQATFQADTAGTHFIRVWAGDEDPQTMRAATLEVPVEIPDLEMANPTQDLATLQAVASASGGEVFQLDQLPRVAAAFTTRRVGRTLEDRQEIWDAPVIYCTILAAILAEWILRKRMRLV
ncbi:MAG: VWA domain-containing protein [Tepidisphaeraceae bacterium]|jgi:hypothetical protein